MKSSISIFFSVLACLWNANLFGQDSAYTQLTSNREVAVVKYEWKDSKRDRVVPVKIYFPKEGPGPFSVILFSHGLGGSREGYEYLGRHWAGCGFVSVHMTHVGSDDSVWKGLSLAERTKALQKAAMKISNATDRPVDTTFAIDQLEVLNADTSSPLKDRLNLKSIGIAGHSFGGYTALAIAGQTFQLPLGLSRNYGDPRVKAAIQMSAPAPANKRNLDATYGSITIPVMHMTGTKDFVEILPQTKVEDRRIPYDHMSNSETYLIIFNDGDHMIFSGRERSAGLSKQVAQDAEFQKSISSSTTTFWDAYLNSNTAAHSFLTEGSLTKTLGNQATVEQKSPKSGSDKASK